MNLDFSAEHMIDTYEWSIAQWSDISLYGPPTKHVFYMQEHGKETREEMLRADLERLAVWKRRTTEPRCSECGLWGEHKMSCSVRYISEGYCIAGDNCMCEPTERSTCLDWKQSP